jgi:hypothetical protein
VRDSGRVRYLPNRSVYWAPADQAVRQEPHPPDDSNRRSLKISREFSVENPSRRYPVGGGPAGHVPQHWGLTIAIDIELVTLALPISNKEPWSCSGANQPRRRKRKVKWARAEWHRRWWAQIVRNAGHSAHSVTVARITAMPFDLPTYSAPGTRGEHLRL